MRCTLKVGTLKVGTLKVGTGRALVPTGYTGNRTDRQHGEQFSITDGSSPPFSLAQTPTRPHANPETFPLRGGWAEPLSSYISVKPYAASNMQSTEENVTKASIAELDRSSDDDWWARGGDEVAEAFEVDPDEEIGRAHV
mgnify:CR=1 FL=1